MFLVLEELCNSADDNTLSVFDYEVSAVIQRIDSELQNILDWYNKNNMVANPDKFQAIFLGTKCNNIIIKLG